MLGGTPFRFEEVQPVAIRIVEVNEPSAAIFHYGSVELHAFALQLADHILERFRNSKADRDRTVAARRILRRFRMQSEAEITASHLCPMVSEPVLQLHAEDFGVKLHGAVHVGNKHIWHSA